MTHPTLSLKLEATSSLLCGSQPDQLPDLDQLASSPSTRFQGQTGVGPFPVSTGPAGYVISLADAGQTLVVVPCSALMHTSFSTATQ
ncbi:unnamed protein product [Protopolystoma xenopodis]|uniref:Uncharacterized protein n=1 Tax=Protopolystoma xenopodis TaxID=117903 RepID=A0A448XK53_9PLAT|nr:unnamed protein product [Protopolystoma xenopodis]